MDKLPLGLSRYEGGIRIRITKNRKVIYSENIKCDSHSATAIKAAKNRHDLIKSRLLLGLPALEDGDNLGIFADVAQDYLDCFDAKEDTVRGSLNILMRYWMPEFQNWPITSIAANDIKKALSKLRNSQTGEPLKSKTKRNILSPLRNVLDHGGVNPNPVDAIKVKKDQKDPVMRYTLKERQKLLKALSGESKVYFALLFGCGLRPCGEPLALMWPDYDGSVLDISKQITSRKMRPYTKTSKVRRVYVPSWAREILNAHPTRFEGGFIFQNENGDHHKDSDSFNDDWREAHKKANVPYRNAYTCRHTRAAELLSTGIEPADAAKQMGHSVEMFLRRYSEYIDEYSRNKDMSRFEGVSVEGVAQKLPRNEGNLEKVVVNQQLKWRTGRDSNPRPPA